MDRVAAVRAFNRFYTGVIGVLDEGLLDSPYSLTEARVIFELAQRERTEVPELRRRLGLDAGYLSRILARFAADGLVRRDRSAADGRRQVVRLTTAGRRAYRTLDRRSAEQVGKLLAPLPPEGQARLVGAMATIHDLLGEAQPVGYVLRAPRPGELGWVVQRHGALYAAEYGWDQTFEALVAQVVGDYATGRDPAREAAWIADRGGEPVGSVFCVRKDDEMAQLRLLLVEPSARGLGIGAGLVEECLRFAQAAGYRRIVLWTNDVLHAARRIYERAGFTLVASTPHHSFGRDLVGQTWERALA
jgi:DNA-binding MarR family transcriptional regulator/GNAT superfamily N-acetyltransferase